MELPILKDKNIFPTNEVLADVLKASFPAFEAFSASAEAAGLTLEWNFTTTGKLGCAKSCRRRKTSRGWLSTRTTSGPPPTLPKSIWTASPTWKLRKASKRNSTGRNLVENSSP